MDELMDGQVEGRLVGWMNKALFRENSLDGLSYGSALHFVFLSSLSHFPPFNTVLAAFVHITSIFAPLQVSFLIILTVWNQNERLSQFPIN